MDTDGAESGTSLVDFAVTAPRRFWMPDLAAAHCTLCNQPFTLFRRRHHCRLCGKIFCHACSSHTTEGRTLGLDGRLVRVCDDCKRLEAQVLAASDGAEGGVDMPGSSAGNDRSVGHAGPIGDLTGGGAGNGNGRVGISTDASPAQVAMRALLALRSDRQSHAAAHASKGRAFCASNEFRGGGGGLVGNEDRARLDPPSGPFFNAPSTQAGAELFAGLAAVADAHLDYLVSRAVQLYISREGGEGREEGVVEDNRRLGCWAGLSPSQRAWAALLLAMARRVSSAVDPNCWAGDRSDIGLYFKVKQLPDRMFRRQEQVEPHGQAATESYADKGGGAAHRAQGQQAEDGIVTGDFGGALLCVPSAVGHSIDGSRIGSCEFIDGCVFRHSLPHKGMRADVMHPRVLIVDDALQFETLQPAGGQGMGSGAGGMSPGTSGAGAGGLLSAGRQIISGSLGQEAAMGVTTMGSMGWALRGVGVGTESSGGVGAVGGGGASVAALVAQTPTTGSSSGANIANSSGSGALTASAPPFTRMTHLSTLIEQDPSSTELLMGRIRAFRPDVLLLSHGASGRVQDSLLRDGVTLLTHVKQSVMQRVSRATGARILPSSSALDKVSEAEAVGTQCGRFRVVHTRLPRLAAAEKGIALGVASSIQGSIPSRDPTEEEEEEDAGGKSSVRVSYCVFSGAPERLHATVILRGLARDLPPAAAILLHAVRAARALRCTVALHADMHLAYARGLAPALSLSLTGAEEREDGDVPGLHGALAAFLQLQAGVLPTALSSALAGPGQGLTVLQRFHLLRLAVCLPFSPIQDSVRLILPGCGEGPQVTGGTVPLLSPSTPGPPLARVAHALGLDSQALSEALAVSQGAMAYGALAVVSGRVVGQAAMRDPPLALHCAVDPLLSAASDAFVCGIVSVNPKAQTSCCKHVVRSMLPYGAGDRPLGDFLEAYCVDPPSECGLCGASPMEHVLSFTHGTGRLDVTLHRLSYTLVPADATAAVDAPASSNPSTITHPKHMLVTWGYCSACKRHVSPVTRLSRGAWNSSLATMLQGVFSSVGGGMEASPQSGCTHDPGVYHVRYFGRNRNAACFKYCPLSPLSLLPPRVLPSNGLWSHSACTAQCALLSRAAGSRRAHLCTGLKDGLALLQGCIDAIRLASNRGANGSVGGTGSGTYGDDTPASDAGTGSESVKGEDGEAEGEGRLTGWSDEAAPTFGRSRGASSVPHPLTGQSRFFGPILPHASLGRLLPLLPMLTRCAAEMDTLHAQVESCTAVAVAAARSCALGAEDAGSSTGLVDVLSLQTHRREWAGCISSLRDKTVAVMGIALPLATRVTEALVAATSTAPAPVPLRSGSHAPPDGGSSGVSSVRTGSRSERLVSASMQAHRPSMSMPPSVSSGEEHELESIVSSFDKDGAGLEEGEGDGAAPHSRAQVRASVDVKALRALLASSLAFQPTAESVTAVAGLAGHQALPLGAHGIAIPVDAGLAASAVGYHLASDLYWRKLSDCVRNISRRMRLPVSPSAPATALGSSAGTEFGAVQNVVLVQARVEEENVRMYDVQQGQGRGWEGTARGGSIDRPSDKGYGELDGLDGEAEDGASALGVIGSATGVETGPRLSIADGGEDDEDGEGSLVLSVSSGEADDLEEGYMEREDVPAPIDALPVTSPILSRGSGAGDSDVSLGPGTPLQPRPLPSKGVSTPPNSGHSSPAGEGGQGGDRSRANSRIGGRTGPPAPRPLRMGLGPAGPLVRRVEGAGSSSGGAGSASATATLFYPTGPGLGIDENAEANPFGPPVEIMPLAAPLPAPQPAGTPHSAAQSSAGRTSTRTAPAAAISSGLWSTQSFGTSLRLSASDMLRSDVKSDIVHSFSDGTPGYRASFAVTSYWAVQFHGLRELCTDSQRSFVQSLAFSERWEASGGKSGAKFEKTCDGRFIVKHVSKTEFDMFVTHIAPGYFRHLHGSLVRGHPSVLVRILGAYKTVVSPVDDLVGVTPSLGAFSSEALVLGSGSAAADGASTLPIAAPVPSPGSAARTLSRNPCYVLVMENACYGAHISRGLLFDLKGKTRAAKKDKGKGAEQQVVVAPTPSNVPPPSLTTLLDGDLLAHTRGQPLPLTDEAKRWLNAALRRDTALLCSLTVVDYSLLVGVARAACAVAGPGLGGAPVAVAGAGPVPTYGKDELVIGIIDYARRFDIVKRLETSVKTVVGAGAEPTVVQPERYARRLLAAADRYFAFIPTAHSSLPIVPANVSTGCVDGEGDGGGYETGFADGYGPHGLPGPGDHRPTMGGDDDSNGTIGAGGGSGGSVLGGPAVWGLGWGNGEVQAGSGPVIAGRQGRRVHLLPPLTAPSPFPPVASGSRDGWYALEPPVWALKLQ